MNKLRHWRLAILLVVVVLTVFGACGSPVRVTETARSPLPAQLHLLLRDEFGLNGNGEDVYLTYLLIEPRPAVDIPTAVGLLENHLQERGYETRPAPQTFRYPAIQGSGEEGTVAVGTLEAYLGDLGDKITEADVPNKFQERIGGADPAGFVVVIFEP